MTASKDEKRIRVTVKSQDAEELKILCRELLLEARAHELAGIEFDLWLQTYHIARKKLPPTIYSGPLATKVRYWIGPEGELIPAQSINQIAPFKVMQNRLRRKSRRHPKQDDWAGTQWALGVFAAFCVGVGLGQIFLTLWG